MTPDLHKQIEAAIRQEGRAIDAALVAYNAVWQAWPNLDAESVADCRRVAMAAAIAAARH
jgi:hypothetical protein